MRRNVFLLALAAIFLVAAIFALSKAHRLELGRSQVWEDGYEQGVYYGLQASKYQFTHLAESGRLDPDAMKRMALDGRTNNPFGLPATNYGLVKP